MIITLASFKGGVAKSTTAIHLAALLQESAPTLLVDHDQENRSVTKWYQRGNGEGLKFRVIDHFLLGREGRNYTHIVIDTKAAPGKEDLENLVRGSDLLIIPCFPEIMALDTMVDAAQILNGLGANSYRVLLTNVPPSPQKDGLYARQALQQLNLPLFNCQIRSAKAFKKASERGVTVDQVRDYDNNSVAWGDYEALAQEVTDIVLAATTATKEQAAVHE
jgi:chromosome partitioning protein